MAINLESRCLDRSPGEWPPKNRRQEMAGLRRRLALAEQVATQYAARLREGDHRIKNSLQIVSSLAHLQAAREEHLATRDALRTLAGRIQSVARMHDALQSTDGKDLVDLGAMLTTMCESLQAMGGDPLAVSVHVDASPIHVPVGFAQPIVLAVNELVVNALRHAFPGGRSGQITISTTVCAGNIDVVVADDGAGLPADHGQTDGYGLKLVRMMTSQIGGVLKVESAAGARFTLTAPAPSA